MEEFNEFTETMVQNEKLKLDQGLEKVSGGKSAFSFSKKNAAAAMAALTLAPSAGNLRPAAESNKNIESISVTESSKKSSFNERLYQKTGVNPYDAEVLEIGVPSAIGLGALFLYGLGKALKKDPNFINLKDHDPNFIHLRKGLNYDENAQNVINEALRGHEPVIKYYVQQGKPVFNYTENKKAVLKAVNDSGALANLEDGKESQFFVCSIYKMTNTKEKNTNGKFKWTADFYEFYRVDNKTCVMEKQFSLCSTSVQKKLQELFPEIAFERRYDFINTASFTGVPECQYGEKLSNDEFSKELKNEFKNIYQKRRNDYDIQYSVDTWLRGTLQ